MAKQITFWLDSGANVYSRNEITVALEDIGCETEEEWEELSEEEKFQAALDCMTEFEWGYEIADSED